MTEEWKKEKLSQEDKEIMSDYLKYTYEKKKQEEDMANMYCDFLYSLVNEK